MSPEDAEIPERVLDAWNRRDLVALLALCDSEIEYVNAPDAVEPGTRRGHEGLTAAMRTQWETMPGAHQDIDRIYDRGEEIFTAGRVSRQMPGSENRIENRILLSWSIRDGKLTRLAVLGGGSEFGNALEAAGLEEQTPPSA